MPRLSSRDLRAQRRTGGAFRDADPMPIPYPTIRSRQRRNADNHAPMAAVPVVPEPAPEPVVVRDIPRVEKKPRIRAKVKLLNDNFEKSDALDWFKELCEVDPGEKRKRIGPSGIQQLAKEIGKDVGDVVFMILAWKMEAAEMGWFTEEEWMKAMVELQIDSPSKLSAQWEYLRGLLESQDTFRNVYRFAYDFTKGNEGYCRHLDVKMAEELIKLFLETKWALCVDFCEFLDATSVRIINKDQYNNVLEFFFLVKDDCSDYDMNSAWPVMMDDFVTYFLTRKANELEEGI